jgi:nucleoside-diphosphate-sugar epimerase
MLVASVVAASKNREITIEVALSQNVAVIVGPRGVIGGNLLEHLQTLDGWSVIGLSRRGGESRDSVRHVSVDLLDADDARRKHHDLADITHVFYAAYQDRPTFA